MEVTPLNVEFTRVYNEYMHGMPQIIVAPNEAYTLEISFCLNTLAAVFIKILRSDQPAGSFSELYRVAFPPLALSSGWNSYTVTLTAPGISDEFCVRVVGVAGNNDKSDPNFGANPEDWNRILADGYFAGRTAEELWWDDFEVAFEFHIRVEGDWSELHKSSPEWMLYLSATPTKTLLMPGETFGVTQRYFVNRYCPASFVKTLIRSEATGEIWELDRWVRPWWQLPYYDWFQITRTVVAPMTPGKYTVRVVGTHSYNSPYATWYGHVYYGAIYCHPPEDLSWTFYEAMAEFTIEVMRPVPPRYYLSVQTSPPGIVTIPGQGWYNECTTVTLEAPQYVDVLPGLIRYRFDYWDVDTATVPGNLVTVHMDANHTATAHYVLQYYLSVDTDPRLLSPAPTGQGWYDECTTVTLLAPSISYYMDTKLMAFDYWTVDDTAVSGNPITVHMDAPHVAIAHYYIPATIDIKPNTLNLRTYVDQWVTGYIELAESWDVAQINRTTILLNGTITVNQFWVDKPLESVIGDYDNDGIPDLMVKFDRATVIEFILANADFEYKRGYLEAYVTIAVTGQMYNGISFSGSDTIRAILPLRLSRFVELM